MKVKELMQTKVFTVAPNDSVDRVFFLLHYEKIRHLPVLERRKVVGIVSDRDLYKVLGPRGRERTISGEGKAPELHVIPKKVRHIMKRGVITVEPDTDAGKAAGLMGRRKIGALPIVRNGRLIGIVTATDLLKSYARLSASLEKIRAL